MIAIIDYGVGNLRSVEKAFHFIGVEAQISSDKEFILNADGVVLPGVGAFADAMESLRKAGMVEVVKEVIAREKPLLGICLGMQLLFEYSEEGGERVEGLGLFKGSIKLLPSELNLKVPHMGWNSIQYKRDCLLFNGLPEVPFVYFVHSYYLTAEDKEVVIATTEYGMEFDVAIGNGKVYATQFHPEKSGEIGLTILKNWVNNVNS
ncbi:MAG: imidazole glycerol phosphate synthase subunit HisH [Clostridia bacterium]|nr:imidazole glycerol phosphate synthase subunit HisH [Clostridia bacterium]